MNYYFCITCGRDHIIRKAFDLICYLLNPEQKEN